MGVKKIYWNEIQKIYIFGGAGIHISSLDYKLVLSPYAFKNSSEIFEYIFKKYQESSK